MKRSCIALLFLRLLMICYYAPHSSCQQQETTKGMQSNKKVHEMEPSLGMIQSHDGIALAYACYVPEQPQAALIFYHGSGAHSLAGYTYMAEQLSKQYNIATFLCDIRGHGRSEGPRGDGPSVDAMWRDVCTALTYVQTCHSNIPVYLGGHSAGAGMLVNYASWQHSKQPAGYVLVAPMLGKHARVVRDKQAKSKTPFVQVNYIALAIHEMTQGLFAGRWHGVTFNYPEQLVTEKGFVKDYTVNMVQTMHPHDPVSSLSNIQVPTLICIADHDELFDATKMDRFFEPIAQCNHHLRVQHVDAYHLTVLGDVHDAIGGFIAMLIS